MKSVAIVYASMYGQTEKIAKHLRVRIEQSGMKACLMNVEDSLSEEFPQDVDAVIIGGPIYFKKYPSSLIEWIPRHKPILDSKPLAFFSVGLTAAQKDEAARREEDEMLGSFLARTGLFPRYVASFAGALNYTDYNWFLRFAMKHASRKAGLPLDTRRDFEYTDWNEVHSFLEAFIKDNRNSSFSTNRRLHLGQAQRTSTASGANPFPGTVSP